MRVLILLLPLLIFWAVWFTVAYARLRRRMNGLDEPVLWLSKRERRARARKMLQREDDEYIQQQILKNTNYLKGETK